MSEEKTVDKKENKGSGARIRISLKVKFFLMSFSLVLAALVVFALLSVFHLDRFSEVVEEADIRRSEIIERDTTGKMQEVSTYNLMPSELLCRVKERSMYETWGYASITRHNTPT